MEKSKSLTYQTAPRYLLSEILAQERSATRLELEILFMRHCIGVEIPDYIMRLFEPREMQRVLALAFYRSNVILNGKDRGFVIAKISLGLGVHKKTVEAWVRKYLCDTQSS